MTENAVEQTRDGLLNGVLPLPSPTRVSESNVVPDIVPDVPDAATELNGGGEHPAPSVSQPPDSGPGPGTEPGPAETAPLPAADPQPPAASPPAVVESHADASKSPSAHPDVKMETAPASTTAAPLLASPVEEPAVAQTVETKVEVKTEPQMKSISVAAETPKKQVLCPQAVANATAPADSDSDDDVPLAQRRLSGLGTPLANGEHLKQFMQGTAC